MEACQYLLTVGCSDIAKTIERAVLDSQAWIKKPPSEILEILVKELKGERCDVAEVFFDHFPYAGHAHHKKLLAEVFVGIYHSKYCRVKKEVKEEKGTEKEEEVEMEVENDNGNEVEVEKKIIVASEEKMEEISLHSEFEEDFDEGSAHREEASLYPESQVLWR